MLGASGKLAAQIDSIIDPARRVPWIIGTDVGVRGGIPTVSTINTTISAGASSATINAAIAACPAGQVVKLGAGSFTITTPLAMKSGVVLRGSGVGVTNLASTTGAMVTFGTGCTVGSYVNINSGFSKGSTQIVVASGTYSVGDIIGVTMDNPAYLFDPDGFANAIYSLHRVESGSSGTTLNLWPALTYAGGANPKAQRITSTVITTAGLEDLTLLPGSSAVSNVVQFFGAYGSWMQNCTIGNVYSYGVWIGQSLGCEIRHVDIYNTVAGSDAYGFAIDNQTRGATAIAVYNCIGDGLFHAFMTSGQNGCVYAFNLSANEHNGTTSRQTAGFNASHNVGGMMTLWEGNYGNHFLHDRIHGAAVYQTLFRNRFHGNDAYNSFDRDLSKYAMVRIEEGGEYWNIVGLVLGDPLNSTRWPHNSSYYKGDITAAEWDAANENDFGAMFVLGYVGFGQALDAAVASTIVRADYYTYWHGSTQSVSGFTLPASLCFAAKPAWFGNLAWPAYDPAAAVAYGVASASRNPAEYRFFNGGADPPTTNSSPAPSVPGVLNNGPVLILSP